MLIGLLDNAQWKNPRFDELVNKLPRGRADLFNLALGRVSRSFLIMILPPDRPKLAPCAEHRCHIQLKLNHEQSNTIDVGTMNKKCC
jgi:hypothetical protein